MSEAVAGWVVVFVLLLVRSTSWLHVTYVRENAVSLLRTRASAFYLREGRRGGKERRCARYLVCFKCIFNQCRY